MKFSIRDFFSKCDQICSFLRILVTFTEEILMGKLHFLCSESNFPLASHNKSPNLTVAQNYNTKGNDMQEYCLLHDAFGLQVVYC